MTPELMVTSGLLAAMFSDVAEQARADHESDKNELGPQTFPVLLLAVHAAPFPIPDPKRDKAQWHELRHLMAENMGLALALVVHDEQPTLLIVKGKLPFDVIMAGIEIWGPALHHALERQQVNAEAEYDDLMARLMLM